MIRRLLLGAAIAIVLGAAGGWLAFRHYQTASLDPAYFEDAIVAFEEADRENPPDPGAIVFVGSSSIRFWETLDADMAPLRVVRRGFGGAHMAHLVHNAPRIVIPYAPSAVVVYAGDNDLADGTGKSVDDVVAEFETLRSLLRDGRPELPIYFITIKPSRLRWDRWPMMDEANRRVAALADADPHLAVLDIATPMLGEPGAPPPSGLFALDGLHLSEAGYALWTRVVRDRLMADGRADTAPSPD